MHNFQYRDGTLYGEDIPIPLIAKEVGTPFYLYSYETLKNHFLAFDRAFSSVPHIVCYSMKANSNLAILRLLISLGAGVDIVSGGELFRSLEARVNPKKVVYSGVGKKRQEMEYALSNQILMFNIESNQELFALNETAASLGKKAPIALRINPDIDPKTHPYISTGMKENKFGIDIHRSMEDYKKARTLKNLDIVGIDCHIGSQIVELNPFIEAVRKIKELTVLLEKEGIDIRYMDIGGGLGITYKEESPPTLPLFGEAIQREIQNLGVTLILEPGRVIVGNAGILVTKVLFLKEKEDKNFVVVDAGMNDLIRPSLYGAYQDIWKVEKKGNSEEIVADVVGPICESSDFLAKKRKIPGFSPEDLMAVMSAGAYGFSMTSNYNSRPRVAEVMVKGREFFVIREREEYSDLIRKEHIPPFLYD